MAGEGQRIPYIIEMAVEDAKIRQQLSKWDWESMIGIKGKGFSDILVSDAKDAKDQVRKVLGGLNLNWKEILGADDMEVFEQGLARVIQGAKKEIRYFGDKKDTAGIERTMEYLSALGEEFASIGSTFDAKQIARSMNSLVSVLNTLEVGAERLKTSFTTLFSKGSVTSLNTIATAMASIGVDKSQITSMKRAREEMEKLAKSSTIKLDIDYGSLSSDELLKALRSKHKAKTANLNDLLDFEWSDITVQLPEITNLDVRRKQLLAIIELEKRIMKETGKSPVNEYFEEDTALRNMAEVKEEFNELTKAAKKSSEEILNQFKQSAKDIKTVIAQELGKLADVKVSLTLDDDGKKSFAQSVNNFVEDFNNQKYGKIEPVKIDLIPNEPEKTTNRGRPLSASKDQIKKATTDIQKELDRIQKEYDEVDSVLNNAETGLRQKVNPDKPNAALNKSIANAEAQLKALEKQIISYKYILSNMDDYEFAKHMASDWKRFASAEDVILASQNKLLDTTRKWRNEMNNLLRFRYTWKVEGTEDEFAGLESALIDLTENHPIRLTPDIDFLAKSIEEGLANKQINVKLTADGPVSVSGVVGNLGVLPVAVVGQPPKSVSAPVTPPASAAQTAPQAQPPVQTQTQSQTQTRTYEDIETDVAEIIKFVEKQVEQNRQLNATYAELLKDAGITDEGVKAYLDSVRDKKVKVPQEVVSKYGSEELFLQKLRQHKTDVGFNNKLPFFGVTKDILKLKEVIENNPEDAKKVEEASEQIKSLLVKSIVDSFKNYFKTSEEQKSKYLQDIKEQEAAKTTAISKYNSEPERKKRNEIIASKQREIDKLQSNTAISEYEKLLGQIEDAKTKGDYASARTLQEQERQVLPAIKQGYQDLIKLRQQLQDSGLYQIAETERKISELEAKTNKTEQEVQNLIRLREHLGKLQRENTEDPNLIAAREAQNAINEKKSRVENIDRRREAYDSLFSLDEIKKLIDTNDTQGISDFIISEILSKSNIAESMGKHKKSPGVIDSIKLFDTTAQQLITVTVGLVQKALGIAQETAEDLDRRVRNEGLINDLKDISKRKSAVDVMKRWENPKSDLELKEFKDLFVDDFKQAKEKASLGVATDRDKAYLRFAGALDEAIEATRAYRTIYNEWTEQEKNDLKGVDNKEEWFKQKYENPKDATRNYQLYTNYNKTLSALQESVDRPKDASGNATGEGVSYDLKRQLQGYVFRVVLVDQNGNTVTTDVGTQRMVEAGKLSKPNKSYKAGSGNTAIFLSDLDPSQAQDIKVYRFPGSRNNVDQPVVDTPAPPAKSQTNTTQVIQKAKQIIDSHNRVVDESKNVITAQEELESANSGLDRANTELEVTQRRMAAITGGKDADDYIKSLRSKKQQPKTVVENKMDNYVKPLSNAIFEETNSAISEETDNITRAILVDNNPLDAIKIPDITKRMMAIVNERRALKDRPQTDATKSQLQKLRDEENSLMAPWAESPETWQLLFGDIRRLDTLTEQLRKKPNDEKLKSDVEQLQNKITQRMHLYEELLGTLPEGVSRLDDISKQKEQIKQTLPKSVEEATAMQQQVQELSNQENLILQSVHQWKDNIKQQGQTVIDSALKKQEEQGAPALAQEYQKQIGELVDQAMSLSAQLEADPNNEGLKTQLRGIVDTISRLTIHYRDLLEKYNVATKGFLGNKAQSQVEIAQKVLSNPLDQSLWGEFDEVPDAVKRRYELYQRSDALFKEKRDASEGRKQEIEREMQNLAQQDKEEKELVLSWIQSLRERTGTGIFTGLGDDKGRLKTITDLRAQLFGTKAEASTSGETNESSSQLSELKELKAQEAAQKLAIENEKERVALAERRLAIEHELTDATITAERHAELTAELEANRNRAAELGVRAKKFAKIQIAPEKLQETYVEIVNAYIDQQQESDAKIAKLQSEIAAQNNKLGALRAPRTPEAVKEGRRLTQNRVIEGEITQKAEKLSETDPEAYARIVEEARDENPIVNFYDSMDEYAAQAAKIADVVKKKSEEYVREMISLSPAEQQRIVDEAIAKQEEAIKTKEAELTAERSRNNQIVAERDKYKIEGQVTDEMIAARRDATQAIRQEAKFVQRTVEERIAAGELIETTAEEVSETTSLPTPTSSRTSDAHYQNYTSGQMYQYGGGVYGIDTSLLATEETLNAIYTLLSGDASRSGMSDAQRKALEAELEAIRSRTANGVLSRNMRGYKAPKDRDPTDLDIGPVAPVTEDVRAELITMFGKDKIANLSTEDLRAIVGTAASDLYLSMGDSYKKIDRHEFYEQNYDAIVEKAIAKVSSMINEVDKDATTEPQKPAEDTSKKTVEVKETKADKQVAIDVKRIADTILTTQRVPSGDLDDRAQVMRGTGYGITPHPGGKEYKYDPWQTARGTVNHAMSFAKSVFSNFVGNAREGNFADIDKYLQYLGEAEKKLLLLDKFFESLKGVQVKDKSSAFKELTGSRDAYLQEINELREIITQVSSTEAQQAVFKSISTHMPKLAFDLSEESAKEVVNFDTKQPIESDIFENGKVDTGNIYHFLRELRMNFQEIESAALYFDRMGDVSSLKKVSKVLSFMGRTMAIFNKDFEKVPAGRDKDFYTPTRDKRIEEGKYLRELINGLLSKYGVDATSSDTQSVAQEAEETSKSLMTIGRAISIINKAIGESTAKTTTGMAKAYANKIHGNADAVEAAKLLYNTPDSEFTSKLGRDTKKKLLDFHGAWADKQKEERPKVLVEPKIVPGAVAEEVKKNLTETPAQAEVHQTTSYGGGFDGTAEEWQEVLTLLNEMSAVEDVQPTAKSGDLIRAKWNEVSGDFTKAEYDELVATFGEPLEKMIVASERQVENEEKKVEASNQQLQNEQTKKEETVEQLKNEQTESNVQVANTEALKSREAEIVAQLEADDKLKAAHSSDNASSGGLIGAINELAKEGTLVKVLQAIGEVAKRQVASASGKGNSAQDLLVRLQKMLTLGIDQKKERVAYMDLATGAMTDSVEGSNTIIDAATFEALRNAYRDAVNFNAQVHTHADESDPYFSKADLEQFAKDATVGIKKQILLSRDSMTVLDMEGAQDVEGLLNALSTTEQTFEALSNTAAQFGATYLNSSFNDMTPQGLVKMLGIKGVESKYTEEETRESAVKSVIAEGAKEAAKVIQESTGRAIKTTRERYGSEWLVSTEKVDAKGNKVWSKQYDDSYMRAAVATKQAFDKLELSKEFGVGTEAHLALTEYADKYAEFLRLTEEFRQNPNKEGLQVQFNELLPKLDEAEEKLNKLILTKDKFLGNKEAINLFDSNQVANAGDNLKALATQRYAQGGIGLGDNIAFNGISDTQFGTRLLVDVLKDGTIKQYALEVDKATGQVKEFMLSETALANAFQNVNKAMRYNETVMAKVAIGDNPTQQQAFMNSAKSPEWNAYKKALAAMEKYVAHIWNRMAQGGRGASKKELDYIMTLSENVLELGKNVQKTSSEFKTFWDQNPSDVTALNIKIKKRGKNVPSRDEQVRAEMEKLAQTKANASGQRYAFSSFDNDTLKYKLTDLSGNIRNVTMVWSELYGQVATISDKSINSVDALASKVEKLKGKFEEAESVGYLNGKNKDLAAFKKQLEDIDNAIKNGDTFENIEAMRQKAIALGDRISKTINQTKGMMVGTGAKKSVDNQYDKIVGTMQGLPDELRPDFGAKNNAQVVQQYIDAYKQLNKDYQKYVDNNKINNPKIQQQLKQQAVHVQMLGKKLLSSATQASKLSDLVEQSGFYVDRNTGEERNLGGVTSVTAQELSNLEGKMRDYVQNGLRQANIEGAKFDTVNQKMTYTFRTSKNTVADMVVQYNKATKSLYAYQKQERESLTGLAGFLQTMRVKTRSILQYVTSMTSIYRVWGMLRQGVQYIKEIDLALVELRKVTDETEATYDRFLQTAGKTASKLGSTISAVTEATATFAKLGYSMQMATEMAEAAIVYKNVGDNIASTEDAADSIISTLKGFGLEANETMRIVDRFNEVGEEYCPGHIVIYG